MAAPKLRPQVTEHNGEGESSCKALGQILERVGDKWTIMIVGILASEGTTRFNALQRAIPGLSHKMLTTTLRGLERDGLVKRTAFATIPPRVDYELTPQGLSLQAPLLALADWASSQQAFIESARDIFDNRST